MAITSSSPSLDSNHLKRAVGFIGLMFSGLASVIGSGWLFASLYTAQVAGPAAILSWIIGSFLSLFVALVFAELGCMLPLAGGLIRYVNFTHRGVASFVGAWLAWISYVTTAPIEVIAVLEYISNYFPWLEKTVGNSHVLTFPGIVIGTIMLAIFTIVNYFGVKWLANSVTTITWFKIIIPIATAIILISTRFNSENFTEFGGFMPFGLVGVLSAVSGSGVIFSYSGFSTIIDMAGEAKNPQRNIPFAIIGTILISMIVYTLLQVAFIGVLEPSQLGQGWSFLSSHTASGPFADFAVKLGLSSLALVLYADAVVSPTGTGLIFTGATTRLTYAMSRNGHMPSFLEKLNRQHVPGWGLLFNFILGAFLFLPFPGWKELVGVISSSVIMSMSFGPICLASMRFQIPEQNRPFKLPFAIVFSAFTFCLCALMLYWTGWNTNWKVFLMILIGLVLLPIMSKTNKNRDAHLNWYSALWIWPYFIGIGVMSYLGSFDGIGLIPQGIDQGIVVLFALFIFYFALKLRLSPEETKSAIQENMTQAEKDEGNVWLPQRGDDF